MATASIIDRVVLQIQSLERGLDGRALPIEVRAGNVFFLDPSPGGCRRAHPALANPFTGFVPPGCRPSGINIIDPHLQSPMVHEFHVGVEQDVAGLHARADVMHDQGIHFLIGRTVGEVYNPVVGGPDRVVNIESSAKTQYEPCCCRSIVRSAGATDSASDTRSQRHTTTPTTIRSHS